MVTAVAASREKLEGYFKEMLGRGLEVYEPEGGDERAAFEIAKGELEDAGATFLLGMDHGTYYRRVDVPDPTQGRIRRW